MEILLNTLKQTPPYHILVNKILKYDILIEICSTYIYNLNLIINFDIIILFDNILIVLERWIIL